MSSFKDPAWCFKDPAWWKSYAIYLAITIPLVVLVTWQLHGWWTWLIVAAISLTGTVGMGRIRRRMRS